MAGGGGTKDWWWHDGKITYFNTIIDKTIAGGPSGMGKIKLEERREISFIEYVAMKYQKLQDAYTLELAATDYRCGDRAEILKDMASALNDEITLINKILCEAVQSCYHPTRETLFLIDEDEKVIKVCV